MGAAAVESNKDKVTEFWVSFWPFFTLVPKGRAQISG